MSDLAKLEAARRACAAMASHKPKSKWAEHAEAISAALVALRQAAQEER